MAQSTKDFLTFANFSFVTKKTGEASHNQQMGGVMDKDCVGANNNMATNYTVNASVQKDSVP